MSLYILDTDHVTLEFEGILVTRNRHDFAGAPASHRGLVPADE